MLNNALWIVDILIGVNYDDIKNQELEFKFLKTRNVCKCDLKILNINYDKLKLKIND